MTSSNNPVRESAKAKADRVAEMEIARVVIKAREMDRDKEMEQGRDWGLVRSKRTKRVGLRRVLKARLAKVRRL